MANPEKPEDDEEDVQKEMFDGRYERVDVVKGPAHAMKFVVLKAGQAQDPAAIATITSSTTSSTPNLAATGSPKEAAPVSKSKRAPGAEQTVDEPKPVTKADTTLDASEVLAEPDKGDPTEDAESPGSPAWEAVDAATARKWTAILARAKGALQVMADRENLEVAVGEGEDMEAAFNLEDASCAIDYAISVLAPFAVDEQTEVDTSVDAVAKAMLKASTDDLDVIESLGPVKKAGRVLSATNEQAIRDAVSSLQKVLASLPAAPEDVTKSKEVPKVDTEQKPVEKAKGDPMVPVYDENGKLCGMVEATDIVPIADAPGAEKEPEPAPEAAADAEPSADAAAPAPAEPGAAAPAPAAPAPAAQEPVAKAEDTAELVTKAVTEALALAEEGHQKVIKQLEERVAHLESQPAAGGPLLNGLATGGGKIPLRGQDGSDGIPPELLAVQKQLEAAEQSGDQAEINRLKRMLVFETLKTGYGMQAPPVIPTK